MSSLRDQLLGLGFKPAPKPERKSTPQCSTPLHPSQQPKPVREHGAGASRKGGPRPGKPRPARNRQDIDLARAYAIRAQKDKDERIEAERLKQQAARERREARAKLAALLDGRTLNDPAAEIARHFEYGGKIKRVYVMPAQLDALNNGKLGVVQQEGRYLLVDAALLAQVEAIFAAAVALKVDPGAPAADDPYADPQYQVPDDLVW